MNNGKLAKKKEFSDWECLEFKPGAVETLEEPAEWEGLSPSQKHFLKLLPSYGAISTCAKAVGVTRQAVQNWRKRDEKFNAAFEEAMGEAVDAVRHAHFKYAIEHPTMVLGRIHILKSRDPDFREGPVEHVHKVEGKALPKQNMSGLMAAALECMVKAGMLKLPDPAEKAKPVEELEVTSEA